MLYNIMYNKITVTEVISLMYTWKFDNLNN